MKIETLVTLQIEKIKICNNEKMIPNKVYQEKEKSNNKFQTMIIKKLCKAKNKILKINKGKKKIIKIQNKIKMSKKWQILIKTRKKKELRSKF